MDQLDSQIVVPTYLQRRVTTTKSLLHSEDGSCPDANREQDYNRTKRGGLCVYMICMDVNYCIHVLCLWGMKEFTNFDSARQPCSV